MRTQGEDASPGPVERPQEKPVLPTASSGTSGLQHWESVNVFL